MGNEVRIRATVKDEVSGPLGRIRDKFDHLGRSQGFKSLAQGVGMGVGIAAWNGLTVAAGATVGVFGDAISSAIEEQKNIAKLDAALRANVEGWDGNTKAIEAQIRSRERLAFSDDDLRDSLALLVAATNDVGKAQAIQATAMDLARLKGIDLRTASEALIKVEAGQFRALKSLGIELRKGATQTEALAAVQAVASGQAAAYAETLTGKAEAAQIRFNDKMEEAGTHALPLISDALTTVTAGLDALEGQSPQTTEEIIDLVEAVSRFTPAGALLRDEVHKIGGTLKPAERAADRYNRAIGTAASKTSDLGDKAEDAKGDIKDLRDELTKAAEQIIDDYYKPLDEWDAYTDARREIRQAQRVLSSKTANAQEREDARDTVRTASRAVEEAAIQFIKTGKYSKKQFDTIISDLDTQIRTATGREKQHLKELRAELMKLNGLTAYINIVTKIREVGVGATVHGDGRASGGPVLPYKTYTVGEKGPETLVMGQTGGFVIPNGGGAPMGVPAGAGMGGGIHLHFHSVTQPTAAQGQELARTVGPFIRDYLARRG